MEFDCKSYLDDDEATRDMFREGSFRPGDMAVSRADGRIRILGRIADVINVQGQKIAVAPVELEIQRELGADEVCVFAGLNGSGQEGVVIVVQTDRALPKAKLERIKFPSFERVRFAFLKEFPRTAGTGKTQRSILRRLVFRDDK